MVSTNKYTAEPVIRVGLLTGVPSAEISFQGAFKSSTGATAPEGGYKVTAHGGAINMSGPAELAAPRLTLSPVDPGRASFTVHGITIGIQFHWERKQSQTFQGALALEPSPGGFNIVNEIPIESYLTSVISSEMSASSPAALLRAHAIVSRSWLLFQLGARGSARPAPQPPAGPDEIIRWYDRESHSEFDVCADDHCQRYQGITKAHSPAVFEAIKDTRGQVLVFEDQICDARYSKSCGGMTESYSAAWQDLTVPYLQPAYDGPGQLEGFALPLSEESSARRWITSSPPAFCNVESEELLARVLPGFDQETRDFYRWRVGYDARELSNIIQSRLGIDLGSILELTPVERGDSGRIVKLRVTGDERSIVIGKELEIRRALSRSHLYSSAFVVDQDNDPATGTPVSFTLLGAGWGHGVGLCQIGAAAMAQSGYAAAHILAHYFKGASIETIY